MPRPPPRALLKEAEEVTGAVDRFLKVVEGGAVRMAGYGSTILSGVLGGFTGMTAAYLLGIAVAPLASPLFVAMLTGLGISGGILLFRRGSTLQLEVALATRQQEIKATEEAVQANLRQLRALPKSTPPEVTTQHWNTHAALTRQLEALSLQPLQLAAPPAPPLPRLAAPES